MDGQLERAVERESQPETTAESEASVAGSLASGLSRLSKSPRLMLALGGTVVVALIAVLVWQTQTPSEGVAQVRRAAAKSTGTARVQPVRKAQNMARIATSGGRIEYISHDELARE